MLLDIVLGISLFLNLIFIIILFIAVKRILKSKGTNEKIKIGETIIAVKKTGNAEEVIQ